MATSAVLAGGQNQIKDADEVSVVDLKAAWPCVQKKVEVLSVSLVWDGPAIEGLKGWYQDKDITMLIDRLASRRVPVADAEAAIKTFAEKQPDAARDEKLTLLFAGLFDKVSGQRRSVLAGIEKYQKAQQERAVELERQGTEIAELEKRVGSSSPDAETPELQQAREKFNWAQRIFQERQTNIPLACELPVLVEERLYAMAQAIRANMKS
ncbi:MAG: hypothetical protein WC807_04370 [Hyphomicrobium sp.]